MESVIKKSVVIDQDMLLALVRYLQGRPWVEVEQVMPALLAATFPPKPGALSPKEELAQELGYRRGDPIKPFPEGRTINVT